MSELLTMIDKVISIKRWNRRDKNDNLEIPGWLTIADDDGFKWYIRICSINTITCNTEGQWCIDTDRTTLRINIEQAAQIMSGMYQ